MKYLVITGATDTISIPIPDAFFEPLKQLPSLGCWYCGASEVEGKTVYFRRYLPCHPRCARKARREFGCTDTGQ